MKSLLLTSLLFFSLILGLKAQETAEDTLVSGYRVRADFVSRYVWRGLQFGGMSVQPVLEYGNGNFFVGSFGSVSFTGTQTMQEADLYAGYVIKDLFTLTVSDYFFPLDYQNNNYFDYNKDSTKHTFEGALQFNGTKKFPISLKVATFFYGNDYRNADGKIAYSTYAELQFNKKIRDAEMSVFAGVAINKSDGPVGYYGNKESFALVNSGLKIQQRINITEKFSLPIYSILTVNPTAENIWLVFGILLSK